MTDYARARERLRRKMLKDDETAAIHAAVLRGFEKGWISGLGAAFRKRQAVKTEDGAKVFVCPSEIRALWRQPRYGG